MNRLLNHGILGEKTILGHCIHINPAEMEILRETGTMVVNNPESNMGNAVGCSPVLQMMERGILVGMGHRRLYPRHAGVPEDVSPHPAA